jgi:ABC-2 type transport system ATP-binding protein
MAGAPIVETIELTKIFRDFWGRPRVKAVDRLNLKIGRGQIVGLLGPNGSGKTTTVRMLLGLLFPTRGVIRVFGQGPRAVGVKRRLGYMPEESHLYPYLNADETLDFYGRLFRLPPAERARRVDYLIDLVGLTRARRRAVREYSKGMARRIGLAQALINDPDLVILDEPTTGLDPIGTREIKDLLLLLKKRNKTILLCSHLLADVEDVCDRITILYGGRMQAEGPVGELLSEDDRLEMVTRRLKPATLERVREVIREGEGSEAELAVGRPRQRLEDYFMQVVEEARRRHLDTAGADVGRVREGFLTAPAVESPTGEALVEELARAGATGRESEAAGAGEGEPARAPSEVRELHVAEPDREVLSDLTAAPGRKEPAGPAGAEGAPSTGAGPEPHAPPETTVRKDVLEELVEKPPRKKADESDTDANEEA